MIIRHERRVTSAEEAQLLTEEKNRQVKLGQQIRNGLSRAVLEGRCFFDGLEHEAKALGVDVAGVGGDLMANIIPRLYDKFDLAGAPIKLGDVKDFLESENLSGLPSWCSTEGEPATGIIVSRQSGFTLNTDAPIVREVRSFVDGREAYGETVSGELVEGQFTAPPYGWSVEVLLLVVAALLRSGEIGLRSQGVRYTKWTDQGAKDALTKIPSFRSAAVFTREGVTFDDRVNATQHLTALYGAEPKLETSAIADSLRLHLQTELPLLAGLTERLRAYQLRGSEL